MKIQIPPSKNNNIIYAILVAVIMLLGLGLRMLPVNNVITDNTVQLKGADAYYFTRQAELIKETGTLPELDPNLCYPQGFSYDRGAALYPYLLAGMGTVMPLDLATAISSPLLALMFMIFIFLLLRELLPDNKFAVLVGLFVASVTGVQFISRSYFGFGDRHVLENVLLAGGLWTLIKSWNSGSLKWAIITAVFFMLYSFSWSQASMLLAILAAGAGLKYIFAKKLTPGFTRANLIAFGAPLLVGLAFNNIQAIGISVVSMVGIVVLHFLNLKVKKWYLRLLSAVLGMAGVFALVYFAFPALSERIIYIVGGFLGEPTGGPVVSEAQPMFAIYTMAGFSLFPPNAVTAQVAIFFFSILGFWALAKKGHYPLVFLGIVLAILSVQRIRTEYYFVIASAIGAAFLTTETRKFGYIIAVLSGIFLLAYGTVWAADLRSGTGSLAFSAADYQMANWMKENLPQIQNPEKPEYGVLNDWQLGYLYTYVADKPMLAEPNFCNYDLPVDFFMMQDEAEAYAFVKGLGIKYVLVKDMSLDKYRYYISQHGVTGEYSSFTGSLKGKKYEFIDNNYFERMATRLFTFDGAAYTPDTVLTIDGTKSLNYYASYAEAQATGATDFYSLDPAKSPVPLVELKHFKIIQRFADNKGGVKLFEVVD